MKRLALSIVSTACLAASTAALAQSSEIFMCVDADGNKTFQNVGTGKGCKRMDVGPVLTVPAGYGTGSAGRNPIGVTFVAGAFAEDKLLAAGYAFEQATQVRLAPSFTNPSMWRCVEGSDFFSPHHCHPGDLLYGTPEL